MKRTMRVFGMAAVAGAVVAGWAAAQEKKKEAAPAPGQEAPVVKPGPEHEVLKKDAGAWDATVEATMEPGAKPSVSKGVEVNTLIGDGLWLIQDFKGEFMGAPFQGHGVLGYDASKKKYVGTWVDSMSMGLNAIEGTYDPKTRTLSTTMEGPCPDGTVMKMRATNEWKDSDTRVSTMYSSAGPGGAESVMMKITYKRRSSSSSPRAN
jgi:hypothetical protein